MTLEHRQDGYLISLDPERLDVDAIHAYLTRSYWAQGIPKAIVARSLRGSLCFGLYVQAGAGGAPGAQVGFARVISDLATFAYLCDVYVLEEHRGKGLSKWLVQVVLEHPDMAGLRRFLLATRDAHGLYSRYGFRALEGSTKMMEITRPDIYARNPGPGA
jgi:GNAT superfamily N-acetyltransferase